MSAVGAGSRSAPQSAEEYKKSFPPVVYVPTTDEEDRSHRRIVMHSMQDGRVALFVYSAPDRLEEYYLPGRPWVLCDGPTLERIQQETPFDLLFLDMNPGLQDEGASGPGTTTDGAV